MLHLDEDTARAVLSLRTMNPTMWRVLQEFFERERNKMMRSAMNNSTNINQQQQDLGECKILDGCARLGELADARKNG